MLEVTTQAQEEIYGLDFAESYKNSDLYRWAHLSLDWNLIKKLSNFRFSLTRDIYSLQKKQSFDHWTKRSSFWLKGPFLSNQILTTILGSVQCLPMEAAQVILAQSILHSYTNLLHRSHCSNLWNYFLETWEECVSLNDKSSYKFVSHILTFCSRIIKSNCIN